MSPKRKGSLPAPPFYFSLFPCYFLLSASGCFPESSQTTLVPPGPFNNTTAWQHPARSSYPPAPTQAAARVDLLGRKVLACNPQVGIKPLFHTIGSPQPEIFHHSAGDFFITEGLVQQCKTDGELAAVLCHELGKMVSEREVLASPKARNPQSQPPMEVRVGNDNAGLIGPPDQTRLAELAEFERDHPKASALPLAAPNPEVLARTYLKQAGYGETELQAVAPILQAASANMTFEKQLGPRPPGCPGTK